MAEQIIAYVDTPIKGAANAEQFGQLLRGSKHGLWRCPGRGYRLLCRLVQKVLIVVVVAVGHRSKLYDD